VSISILSQAIKEKDERKQNQLVQKGVSLLQEDPISIKIGYVAQLLAKTNNFATIVDLCARKVIALER
jgi:hypothetical protein